MNRILTIVPVWGEEHRNFYLNYTLPSHLASGNLPYLQSQSPTTYLIGTMAEDVPYFEAHPLYQKLQQTCTTKLIVFNPGAHNNFNVTSMAEADVGKKYTLQNYVYKQLLQLAREQDIPTIIACFTADVVFSNGYFTTAYRALTSGYKAIGFLGCRTVKETMLPILDAAKNPAGLLELPPRQMVRWLLDQMHPFTRASQWQSDHFTPWPTYLSWPVGRDGIIVHAFHIDPKFFWFDPSVTDFRDTHDMHLIWDVAKTIDKIYLPATADEGFAFECSAYAYTTDMIKPNRADELQILPWVDRFTELQHLDFAARAQYFNACDITPAWDPVAAEAKKIVTDLADKVRQHKLKMAALQKEIAKEDLL